MYKKDLFLENLVFKQISIVLLSGGVLESKWTLYNQLK